MPRMQCKISALLLLSLVPFAPGVGANEVAADADEIATGREECNPQMAADGECEESLDLLDESNDALSLIQHRMSVAGTDSATASGSSSVNGLVQAAISMYEKNGGKVTPEVQAFLTAVLKQIEGLYPKIKDAHTSNVEDLERLYSKIKDVMAKLEADKKTAAGMGAAVASLRKELSTCRTAESGIWSRHQTCLSEKAALTEIKNAKSKAAGDTLVILRGMFGSEPTVEEMLDPGFRGKLSSTLLTFKSQNKELDIALDNLAKKTKECEGIAEELSSEKTKCDDIQSKFEGASCKTALFVSQMCKDFEKDFSAAVADYEKAVKSVESREADRKVEQTGLKHAECILKAISGDDLSPAKIESCKSEVIDTSALDIDPAPTPEKPPCPPVPPYPCTAKFKDIYYKMPKGTKAAKCEECVGM